MAGIVTDKMSSLAHQPPFQLLLPIAALHILLLPFLLLLLALPLPLLHAAPRLVVVFWLSTVDLLHGAAV